MDNQLTNIGIVRESRNDENRTPLVPEHIKKYKESNPNINFIIQPSNSRCFSDEEYELCGAKINENLNECSIIFGVKEIDPNILINNRTYLFFSHTFKINKQQKNIEKHKKDLLLSILNKKIILASKEKYQKELNKKNLGLIETEIKKIDTYFYAEQYHQQYLASAGNRQYCSAAPTKVKLGVFPGSNFKLNNYVWENFNWEVDKCVLRSDNNPIKDNI